MLHVFYQKHTKRKYHLVTPEPLFTVNMINCVHQTGPRKGAQHPAVCYPQALCLPSLSLCWSLSKLELCLSSIGVKVNGQYCWDILLSQQMLDAMITSFITILSFSETVHSCILHSTQSSCCSAKLSTSFLLSYDPHNSPELNSTDNEIQTVTKQHEYELQVIRLSKFSQQLVKVSQCNSTAFKRKDSQISGFPVSPGSAEALVWLALKN